MMQQHLCRSRQHGFTLIELLVTIALMAVMMTLAAPSFVQYQRNSELTSLTNTLLAAINAAKSEAMKTGRSAFVSPLGTGWESGWVVYVDVDRDNLYKAGTDVTVQTQEAVKAYFTITGTGSAAAATGTTPTKATTGTAAGSTPTAETTTGATPYIRFDSSGYAVNTSGGSGNLTLTIQRTDTTGDAVWKERRLVIVARTGRVRACKPASDKDAACKSTTGS